MWDGVWRWTDGSAGAVGRLLEILRASGCNHASPVSIRGVLALVTWVCFCQQLQDSQCLVALIFNGCCIFCVIGKKKYFRRTGCVVQP